MKGFRPGKAPPEVKKQQAKATLGSDAGWAQKAMVEAVGGRSPREVDRMLGRWAAGVLAAAVLTLVLGSWLYTVSWIVGVATHLVTAVLIFFWIRIRKQRAQFVELASSMEGGG